MVSLKQKQSGFTIVELLIVIVIIGILAALIITQVLGATQSARDSERKTDLASLASQLEAYYTKNGGYPTLANLNSADWRAGNQFVTGDSNKALYDPRGTAGAANPLAATATATVYAYSATDDAGAACVASTDDDGASSNATTPCTKFTLDALLENTNDKDKTDVSGVAHYIKKSATSAE